MGRFAELHEAFEEDPDQSGAIHKAVGQARHPGSVRYEAQVRPDGDKFRVTHHENGKYTGQKNDRHFDDKKEAINHANTHVQRASNKL